MSLRFKWKNVLKHFVDLDLLQFSFLERMKEEVVNVCDMKIFYEGSLLLNIFLSNLCV